MYTGKKRNSMQMCCHLYLFTHMKFQAVKTVSSKPLQWGSAIWKKYEVSSVIVT